MKTLSPVLKFHLKFFQLLGYFVMPKDPSETYTKPLKWKVLNYSLPFGAFCAFSTLTAYVFFGDEEFRYTGDAFGYFNDTLKLCFAQLAITTFYWESLRNSAQVQQFWKNYLDLQSQKYCKIRLSSEENNALQLKKHSVFLFVFYGLTLANIAALVIFAFLQNVTKQVLLFWCMFTPFIFFVHFRIMQFIFHLELVRLELVQLKIDLSLLADYTRFVTRVHPFKGFENFLRLKLLEKQKIYQSIYELCGAFQNGFGYSIITALAMVYVRVLVDSYFICYKTYLNLNRFEILMLIPSILEIPAFLITSMNCMNVVKHISYELHSIISPLDDTTVSVQIQNFSLQMLHQKIIINGVGISTMDGYMLSRAIGSITTYMIFFIQFMPKFNHN